MVLTLGATFVLDRALPDNECVHDAAVYKNVGKRYLEVIVVENECAVCHVMRCNIGTQVHRLR